MVWAASGNASWTGCKCHQPHGFWPNPVIDLSPGETGNGRRLCDPAHLSQPPGGVACWFNGKSGHKSERKSAFYHSFNPAS